VGWSIGYDSNWDRDIGYGVPCRCDHPDCAKPIHRGLAYVCGGHPYGGEDGCGLFFCGKHLLVGVDGKEDQVCERCADDKKPFDPKPDTRTWIRHKLQHSSWKQWRNENPQWVADARAMLAVQLLAKTP
jgi:hypothetical protein